MRSAPKRALTLASVLVWNVVLFSPSPRMADSTASDFSASTNRSAWLGPNAMGTFARKMIDGRTVCLEAAADQARIIKDRAVPLIVLDPFRDEPPGLKIMLRGTSQFLSSFLAVEAFKRAAAQWEALVQTHITVIVDVDFGPAVFGKPFEENVVGIADAQVLGGNSLYPAVRAGLTSGDRVSKRMALYDSLPAKTVPTDSGESTGIATSSAELRALRLINPIAGASGELSVFGPPPAIAFNSSFSFDFDSSGGIDKNKLDFEAMAIHEIGHVLGFVSFVGQQEIDSSIDAAPSVWDLFRVRSDAAKIGFTTARRILSSGGEQDFFAGDAILALSTGRPDGGGGDGRESAHWKDDELTGQFLGVMDPTIGPGEHQIITDNDAMVLDALGYRTTRAADPFLVPLSSGQSETGGMVAPPLGLGFLSHTQYSIAVPAGATQLKIDLSGDQDVDLFVRFGQRVVIQGFRPAADYQSRSSSGAESITITLSTALPLRPGTYYIAVANYGPGEATFTVTATVNGGSHARSPAIFNLKPHLDGDVLGLEYAAVDLDADLARADVNILDDAGRTVSSSSIAISSGTLTYVQSQLSLRGLSTLPSALRASVVLVDRSGNKSAEGIADFSRPEVGGLRLTSASFDGSRLVLRVSGLAEGLALEINGHDVALKVKAKGSGNKLIVNGDASQLTLQLGTNRIRIKNVNGWSNILLFQP